MLYDEEPSQYLFRHKGEIEWRHPDGGGDTIQIGAFTICFVDTDAALNDGVAAYDVFDTEATTFDVFQSLYNFKTGSLLTRVERIAFGNFYVPRGGLLLLERLVVYPDHRGHGVGLLVLRTLLRHYRSFAGVAVMKPFPLQFEGDDDSGTGLPEEIGLPKELWNLKQFSESEVRATTKLRRYYSKLGFDLVPRTKYMVRSCDLQLPEISELGFPN